MEQERTNQQKVFIGLFNLLMETNPYEYGQVFFYHEYANDVYAWAMNDEDMPTPSHINHVLAALTSRLTRTGEAEKW